jgi:hypothetical protein
MLPCCGEFATTSDIKAVSSVFLGVTFGKEKIYELAFKLKYLKNLNILAFKT